MKLPFIQHIGIGLHITRRAIRWVKVNRIGDTSTVNSVDVEKVAREDLKESLKRLIERQGLTFPYVTVNLDSFHIREKLIEVPEFDEQEYLEYWLEEQEKDLVPEGLSSEEFVIKHHFLGNELDERFGLFVITRKEAIEERRELLESVGLKPLAITTGQLQAGYGLIFNKTFSDGKASLVSIFEDSSSLQFYNDGIVERYIGLSASELSLTEVIEEAKTYLATERHGDKKINQDLYLAASEYYLEDESLLSVAANSLPKVKLANPLSEAKNSKEELSADLSIAAGMAVRQLYPAMDSMNMFGEEDQQIYQDEVLKKDALNTGLLSGGSVVFLYFLLMLIQFVFSSNLQNTSQQVRKVEDNINTVNMAATRVKQLKQQVDQARELVTERTSMAQKMELIGRSLPDRVWFSEISISNSKIGKEVVLYGYAHNDALVASLMERLEKEESTDRVRLIFSSSINSEDVYNDTSLEEVNLVQFEVRLTINPDVG